jgi:cytidylate kinase
MSIRSFMFIFLHFVTVSYHKCSPPSSEIDIRGLGQEIAFTVWGLTRCSLLFPDLPLRFSAKKCLQFHLFYVNIICYYSQGLNAYSIPERGQWLITVSIDGPAGSGKSTTARLVAQKLGYLYIDTGAMYRAATLRVLSLGVNPQDEKTVVEVVRDADIKLKYRNSSLHVLLNKRDVTKEIRSPKVTQYVSLISSYREVREQLVALQRAIAENNNVVCEGRDIGSVVFPNADVKVYLDCSLEERAKRRLLDLQRARIRTTLKEVTEDIKRRDTLDSERELSPLIIPNRAEIINTSHLSIREQVDRVLELVYSLEGV